MDLNSLRFFSIVNTTVPHNSQLIECLMQRLGNRVPSLMCGGPTVNYTHMSCCEKGWEPQDPRYMLFYVNVHRSIIHDRQKVRPLTFINKMWSIQAQESYFTIKRNEILSYATTWVNLEHNKSKKPDTKGCIIS